MRSSVVILILLSSTQISRGGASTAAASDLFETRIRPLLARNCYGCHTTAHMGNLQLDTRVHLLQGGNSGPAIVPGKAGESLLIQAVRRTHERFKMPPQGALKDEEIADLVAWVNAGAVWPETDARAPAVAGYAITAQQRAFWSFQPVRKPALPTVHDRHWAKTPIDHFILAGLEQKGLKPAPPAHKRDLIRRVTFDLTGLPPAPQEIDAFLSDSSPDAFAKVVDRLLASPQYGERWGRHWLDLARYADGKLGAFQDDPFPNAYRYRDWVIDAFNRDMPYDVFVKAQIAGDVMPEGERASLVAGLGFQAMGRTDDDQVDVTTRTFLGLTVGCAQCHDHKYDPIPTKDYYSLLGIFRSSEGYEYPLAPSPEVQAYKQQQSKIETAQAALADFVQRQSSQLSEILAGHTASYIEGAWRVLGSEKAAVKSVADEMYLDGETLGRWVTYLKDTEKEHPYLKPWYEMMSRDEVNRFAAGFQTQALAIIAEKQGIDDRNYVKLGGAKGVKDEATRQYANLEFLDVDKYYLWRDLCSESYKKREAGFNGGVYYYGEKQIGRFLGDNWREFLERQQAELAGLKNALPGKYPFLVTIRDKPKPANVRVAIRGEATNLGEEAPRRFLAILCDGEPRPFTQGSGRLELANAIATARNPLTSRVIVNRVWELHFGRGIVRTPSNFGNLGERASHPELLDWLASRLIEDGWSMKRLHREILLSSTYAMSTQYSSTNYAVDPDNRLLWRANLVPRLDAEALRDAILAVTGDLDLSGGGPAVSLDDKNKRRTVYAYVSRSRPNGMLSLFDFPDANNTSEHRLLTSGPLQRLFFLNSSFVAQESKALAARVEKMAGSDDSARIRQAYLLVYGRPPDPEEVKLGLEFLRKGQAWPEYAQILLSSNEFSSVN